MKITNLVAGSVALYGLVLMAPMAHSATLYTASSGNLAASANFDLSGNTLTVTLTNTSASDVLVPADVLTAVLFSVSGGTLSPQSAALAAGSQVFFGPSGSPAGNVGGEWAYGTGGASPLGTNAGISSS